MHLTCMWEWLEKKNLHIWRLCVYQTLYSACKYLVLTSNLDFIECTVIVITIFPIFQIHIILFININLYLNELWFFKDCSTGSFGADCDSQCSEFCRKKSCHRTTGTCLHGCETGYIGTHCNQSQYSDSRILRNYIEKLKTWIKKINV